MDATVFVFSVLTILATPGPTNTLLAASGATIGLARSLKLIPAEIGGYLVSISLLMALAAPATEAYPHFPMLIKLAASFWLVYCAWMLWRDSGKQVDLGNKEIGWRRVFVTTLLNPKGLIFALVIIPAGSPAHVVPWLAAFSVLVALVATGWILLGRLLTKASSGTLATRLIWKAASLILLFFACAIGASVAAGIL